MCQPPKQTVVKQEKKAPEPQFVPIAPVVCANCGLEGASQCGRCRTWYCGESCQKAAWSKGHKTDCKRIARAGGYEQAKAVEEAAKAARAAKPGAGACGICGQDGGPVVHGCGCASPAHLKCLERAARDFETNTRKLDGWHRCLACDESYETSVALAMGRACWARACPLPESDWNRIRALSVLGAALNLAGHSEEALAVRRADLKIVEKHRADDTPAKLDAKSNLAAALATAGRSAEALKLEETIYTMTMFTCGIDDARTLGRALILAAARGRVGDDAGERKLLADTHEKTRRVLGAEAPLTIEAAHARAQALLGDPALGKAAPRFAESLLQDCLFHALNTLGAKHSTTLEIVSDLDEVRETLAPSRAFMSGMKLLDTTCWPLESLEQDVRQGG